MGILVIFSKTPIFVDNSSFKFCPRHSLPDNITIATSQRTDMQNKNIKQRRRALKQVKLPILSRDPRFEHDVGEPLDRSDRRTRYIGPCCG